MIYILEPGIPALSKMQVRRTFREEPPEGSQKMNIQNSQRLVTGKKDFGRKKAGGKM
jgi:hypothetical protein